jgi:ADP-ribosyl-[dinitrogen reductase] hydrolase
MRDGEEDLDEAGKEDEEEQEALASPVAPVLNITGKLMRPEIQDILDLVNVQTMQAGRPPWSCPKCKEENSECRSTCTTCGCAWPGGTTGYLGGHSIFQDVPVLQRQAAIESSMNISNVDRAMGAVCGMAIGHTLGQMFQFLPAQETPGSSWFDLKTFKFHNTNNAFKLELGQWTGDASMALCIADSLIYRKGFDGSDIRARFWCWWHLGYNNAFRLDRSTKQSVGLRKDTSPSIQAMTSLKPGDKPSPAFESIEANSGSGGLTRIAALAVLYHRRPLKEIYEVAHQSAYATHPGFFAAECCTFLAHLIGIALLRLSGHMNPKRFLEDATVAYLKVSGLHEQSGPGYDEMKWLVTGAPVRETERCWAWRKTVLEIDASLAARGEQYNGHPVSDKQFGSFSLDGMACAMWAVYNTSSFDEAVSAGINLLGDAEGHGAIIGQIAGAFYGYSSINSQFLSWLNRWDEHDFAIRAVILHELGCEAGREHHASKAAAAAL